MPRREARRAAANAAAQGRAAEPRCARLTRGIRRAWCAARRTGGAPPPRTRTPSPLDNLRSRA